MLQIAENRREAKGKGKKERYTHLNAEFQRKARGDKKAFLSDQCKGIEENNRMGNTRDLLMWRALNLHKVYLPPSDMHAIEYSDFLKFLAF